MERNTLRCLAGVVAFAAAQLLAAEQKEPAVKVYTDGLPTHVAEQIQKHAAEGETALKQYLERTKNLHRLRYDEVTQPRMQPVSDGGGLQKEPKKHANDYR